MLPPRGGARRAARARSRSRSAYRWISPAASGCSTQARLVPRRRRGLAGGTVWTSKRLPAPTGCCSIFRGRWRPGAARRMTRLRRACGRARSASTVLRGRSAIRSVEPAAQRVAAGQRDLTVGGHPVTNSQRRGPGPQRRARARPRAGRPARSFPARIGVFAAPAADSGFAAVRWSSGTQLGPRRGPSGRGERRGPADASVSAGLGAVRARSGIPSGRCGRWGVRSGRSGLLRCGPSR